MLQYGDITRDPAKLPEPTLKALLQRGFAHYLGNEQASKVVTKIRQAIVNGTERTTADVSKDEVRAYREANAETVESMTNGLVTEALETLDKGTIGTSVARGPARDPVASAAESIAWDEVKVLLKNSNLKAPKGDETVTTGSGVFTRAQLIERRLVGKEGDRIRKEAEQRVAAAKRKAAKVVSEGAEF